MNFVGHAVVAAGYDDDPTVLFGSMLPDFATMVGARLGEVDHRGVARGVELHHATDDAFHGAPTFVDLMGMARDELEAEGVSLGPALAVGHVGVELILDGWLVDERAGESLFERALEAGAGVLDSIRATRRRGAEDASPAFGVLVRRLDESPIPGGYRDPDFVAERLRRVLDGRPRLRMSPEEVTLVHAWARRSLPRIWARADTLMHEVSARLGEQVSG